MVSLSSFSFSFLRNCIYITQSWNHSTGLLGVLIQHFPLVTKIQKNKQNKKVKRHFNNKNLHLITTSFKNQKSSRFTQHKVPDILFYTNYKILLLIQIQQSKHKALLILLSLAEKLYVALMSLSDGVVSRGAPCTVKFLNNTSPSLFRLAQTFQPKVSWCLSNNSKKKKAHCTSPHHLLYTTIFTATTVFPTSSGRSCVLRLDHRLHRGVKSLVVHV